MNQRSVVYTILPIARDFVYSLAGLTPAAPFRTLTLTAIMLGGSLVPAPAAPPASETEKSNPQADGNPPKPPVTPLGKDDKPPAAPPVATAEKQIAQALKLPGLVINQEKSYVDVEASICLVDGPLEVIACTKDTKEHESIVVIAARPVHIHAALLLLGAKNGNPAMRRALDKEQTRWIDVPPRGDLIEVFLEFKDIEGKLVERPISDFITRSEEPDGQPGTAQTGEAAAPAKFPNSFIFAGSQLADPGPENGQRQYLADQSGDVISISTFGDELLCLPDINSQENGALTWGIDPTHMPKLGTKVTLRLRIKKKN